jgi:chromatin remodeling complex protein RSC6
MDNKSKIVKTFRISDQLAEFLKKPTGYEMSKNEVVTYINNYIRSNKLQDNENGRNINRDIKLTNLLKLKNTDNLTYTDILKYITPHFEREDNFEKMERLRSNHSCNINKKM